MSRREAGVPRSVTGTVTDCDRTKSVPEKADPFPDEKSPDDLRIELPNGSATALAWCRRGRTGCDGR